MWVSGFVDIHLKGKYSAVNIANVHSELPIERWNLEMNKFLLFVKKNTMWYLEQFKIRWILGEDMSRKVLEECF